MRLALFDIDGTLVDSQYNIIASLIEAMTARGFDAPAPETIRRLIGLSLPETMATLLPEADEKTQLEIAEAYRDNMLEARAKGTRSEPLFAGAAEALDTLEEAGWLLGLATGKSRVGTETTLRRHNLAGRFVTVQTADDNPGKPHPSMVRRAMAETGVGPEATAMIGDTVYDMTMARSAGSLAVGVSWGYHPPAELVTAGANVIVSDFSSLPAAIEELVGRASCGSVPS